MNDAVNVVGVRARRLRGCRLLYVRRPFAAPAGGLPTGVQLVGRPWADDVRLGPAEVLQSVTGHHERAPGGLDVWSA
ncbi:hypothetical protein OG266_09415 [Streptomyces sp. NBC_00554]|uniref:hypothetical protein n=1 Tax=Streptomyces sp. NBC_00554 TaxID=2903661 RepID=UPI00352EDB17|nr:hypothetical protein OG266_09415 [Streptomyces sp. NBC_00554]